MFSFAMKHFKNYILQNVSYSTELVCCQPTAVSIDLTSRCNSRCRCCDIWKQKNSEELGTKQWKNIIKELHKWLGTYSITFSGGEPLLRDDLPEIIQYCSELNIFTNLLSNGLCLDRERVKLLKKARLSRIAISIDSHEEEKNDYLRGVKGNWKKAVNGIQYLKEISPEIKITVATVISKVNFESLIDHIVWGTNLGISALLFQPVDHNFGTTFKKDWYVENEFWPNDIKKIEDILDKVIEMKNKGYPINNTIDQLELMKKYFEDPLQTNPNRICKVGVTNFPIDPSGKVNICYSFKHIGKFYDENGRFATPKEIWSSAEAKKIRHMIKNCSLPCSVLNCNYDIKFSDKVKKFMRLMKE